MTQFFALSLRSKNAKTGRLPVSTSAPSTCPTSCPLRGAGCYADLGPLSLSWSALETGGLLPSGRRATTPLTINAFAAQIAALPEGQLWRHNQAGDLPGEGDRVDLDALDKIVEANRGRRGFTFSHKTTSLVALQAIRAANAQGFVVNLSANDLAHADRLAETGAGPVVTVLPSDAPDATETPAGRRVITCPAQTGRVANCVECGLCQRAGRKAIVGFRAHGNRARQASVVASRA